MKLKIFSVVLLFSVSFQMMLWSQQSVESDQPERLYEEALGQYNRGYYGEARHLFEACQQQATGVLAGEAAFYEALSARALNNEDAAWLMEEFMANYPQSNRLSHARFVLGEIAQDEDRAKVAIRWYDQVDPSSLSPEVRLRYYFKAGYAAFEEGDHAKAAPLLAKAKDTPSQWWSSANYYYAHIQYEDGHHDQALATFLKLKDEPGFRNIIPYYVAQIYYMKGDYDKAIDYGTPLMADAKGVMRTDLARVLGDAWFAKGEYARAIPYITVVVEETKTPLREDYYHLGLSCYFTGDYAKAADYLAQVTSGEDAMTQNAYYHLADCFLKLGDKKNARVAFEAAARYAYDDAIKEDAMFNNIKLSYELSFSPFNEIITSLLQFIEAYPNSGHIDDAYSYLGQALLTTRNYRQALEAMESITLKNDNVYKGMQRVAYHRGLELFTNLQFTEAIAMFDYSLKYGRYDRDVKMSALYWRAEANYRLGNYREAQSGYIAFLQMPGVRQTDEFAMAHYNLGYVCFKMRDYAESGTWFRQYVSNASNAKSAMVGDAYNRIGDTYYMVRGFKEAIKWYDKAAGVSAGSPDYALFQKALAMGFVESTQARIRQLQALVAKYPTSGYVDDAMYELGRSYVTVNDLPSAIRYFKTVRDRFQHSRFANKSMLQLGLVYYNTGDFDNSLVYYKRVVNEYPGTPEAEDALLGIRNIYMDQDDPNGYISYTNQIGGFARVDDRQRDSLTYMAAERLYMSGKVDEAIKRLEGYLKDFQQGRFELNAHYYLADSYYRKDEMTEALKSYEFVTGRGKSLFSEDALLRAASIHYHQGDYSDALDYFRRLEDEADLEENRQEAVIGQMRSLSKMDNPQLAINAAQRVIENSRMAPEIVREAHYLKASSHLQMAQEEEALQEFLILSANTSSNEGAEAKFRVAEIYNNRGNSAKAEEVIFDFINKGTPHQYWLAKGFILLSDIYADRHEYFQAAQYLEGLLDNYVEEDDDIRVTATGKLKKYKASADAESQLESAAVQPE
jgi:TolA-binding protein